MCFNYSFKKHRTTHIEQALQYCSKLFVTNEDIKRYITFALQFIWLSVFYRSCINAYALCEGAQPDCTYTEIKI